MDSDNGRTFCDCLWVYLLYTLGELIYTEERQKTLLDLKQRNQLAKSVEKKLTMSRNQLHQDAEG